ncbi:ISL3 family transposase [Streptomyces sp. NPDC055709]
MFATWVTGSATTRPRDLTYGESGLEFRWHKRRWWCREPGCPRRSFTEQTAETRGRRGRATDPEWKARRHLLRNREDLTDEQFATMWNTLLEEGEIGQRLTAWIAKENLRTLLARARTGADRHPVGHARWKFLTWCADSDIPEVRQLAVTVDRWWPEIEAFIDTGHSNAKSEGINRVIKLVARNAFGFRNADNQRLRTHCVTTRRARGHLRTAQL